jgi:peptidoglycan hydrolase-like protein with peptidoglycan-binding domain
MVNNIAVNSSAIAGYEPPSQMNQYKTDMDNLVTALQNFQGATDPNKKAAFLKQVQLLLIAVNNDYNTLRTDGNYGDSVYADSDSVQMVFDSVTGILNVPVDGSTGDDSLLDAAAQGTTGELASDLSAQTTTGQWTLLIQELQNATPQ